VRAASTSLLYRLLQVIKDSLRTLTFGYLVVRRIKCEGQLLCLLLSSRVEDVSIYTYSEVARFITDYVTGGYISLSTIDLSINQLLPQSPPIHVDRRKCSSC
jgi:hypothetical protein